MESLIANGVIGVKAFLCDSGLDEFPAADETTLRSAMPVLKAHKIPLLVHAELVSHIAMPKASVGQTPLPKLLVFSPSGV